MRLRVLSSLLLLFFPACQLAAQATSNAQKFSPPTRTFRFTYNFTVKDIPSGAKRVRVWAPVPQTANTKRLKKTRIPVDNDGSDSAPCMAFLGSEFPGGRAVVTTFPGYN